MKIKSSYNATIVLPPNFPIYPGAEVDYPHWAKHKANPAIDWYVDNGHLTLGEAKEDKGEELPGREFVENVNFIEVAPVVEQNPDVDEDERKDALIAQLKELDIKADKRSSVEKLQEKLDEALAK